MLQSSISTKMETSKRGFRKMSILLNFYLFLQKILQQNFSKYFRLVIYQIFLWRMLTMIQNFLLLEN